MEILRILFAFGFLSPVYFAMEIQPSILPRNLDVYCKVCQSIYNIFDNISYEDYDLWRTVDVQDKLRIFCSICKKKTESTTLPTTMTSSETTTALPETTSISPKPTTISPETTSTTPETTSIPPEPTSISPETTSTTLETTSTTPETTSTTSRSLPLIVP